MSVAQAAAARLPGFVDEVVWISVRSVGIASSAAASLTRKKPVAIGSRPSLWPSVEIELTPGSDRSNGGIVVAEVAHERQDEPAERGVDVEVQARPTGEVRERLDRVEHAEAAARCGADETDRLRRDRPLDVLDPRQVRVVVDVDLDQPDAHQLGARAGS